MAFENLSFETAGGALADGGALGWVATPTATHEAIADFAPAPLRPWEDFARGWDSNDGYLFAFTDPAQLSAAAFAIVDSNPVFSESFDVAWNGNENFEYDFLGLQSAKFSTTFDYELFDNGWLNDAYLTALAPADLTPAAYGVGTVEAFEHTAWHGAYATTWDDVVADTHFVYENSSQVSYEGFELLRLPVGFDALPGTDVLATEPHLFVDFDVVFVEGDNLPAPLAANVPYVTRDVGAGAVKLSLTQGGPIIDLTTSGSGTRTLVPDPAGYWVVKLHSL